MTLMPPFGTFSFINVIRYRNENKQWLWWNECHHFPFHSIIYFLIFKQWIAITFHSIIYSNNPKIGGKFIGKNRISSVSCLPNWLYVHVKYKEIMR